MKRRLFVVVLTFLTLYSAQVQAQFLSQLRDQGLPQLKTAWRSFGPEQLWTDELVYGKWRIQRSELSGQYRLLDPAENRRAWGTEQECRAAFAAIRQTEVVPAPTGRAVITLHGLGRSRDHMQGIGQYLEKHGGYTWINVSYASTRRSLDDHAATLAHVIDGLDGVEEINFVAHSLGNLVVRRYLGEAAQLNPRWNPDPRIKRMVMLGPPNNGAQLAGVIAELLNNNELARLVTGPSAWQLAREWETTQKLLGTPPFEFGVIAGGAGNVNGLNPLLEGDDDLVVRVEETRLPGACDFRVVPARHGELVYDPRVQQYTLNFLQGGCFTSADQRQPIAALVAAATPPSAEVVAPVAPGPVPRRYSNER
jgi:pimeloyl-ACP methyl ester carboxylesterase